MRSTRLTWSRVQLAVITVLSAGLFGCGGGGGDDNFVAPTATLDITAANRDTVAHFTAAGLMALPTTLGTAGMVTLLAGREQAYGGSGQPIASLLQSLRAHAETAGNGRRQALAVSSVVVPCDFGGTLSMTLDDRDGSSTITAGDVLTVVFNSCLTSPTETLNGTMAETITQISATSASSRLDLVQYSDTTANHSFTVDGSVLRGWSPPDTPLNTRLTANGPVKVAVNTHLPFADTVTLSNGFVMDESFEGQVSTSSFTGSLESLSAGGIVDVSTIAAVTKSDAEAYPSAGTVKVKGRTGTLQMNVLSAASVRLDLDANDDGAFESTTTVPWDWLL